MKLSIVTKTFRIHDNPFLDSDVYIIYINEKEYGENQQNFLNHILQLHLLDLEKIHIKPIIINNLTKIKTFIKNKENVSIYVDQLNPIINYPFHVIYLPSWCLIDWRDKVELIQQWFLPEALKNHKVFKKYVHSNIRTKYDTKPKLNKKIYKLKSNYTIELQDIKIPLPIEKLEDWILLKLQETKFMNHMNWYKPNTSPSTSINNLSCHLPELLQTSKLSPFISLGVLSPLIAYQFYNGEERMGSGRDQLLFREMFHACSQMPEFWLDNFGQEYQWKTPNNNPEWIDYLEGNTPHKDVNFAMKTLKQEGWIHHLARHLVADYLTRGKLEIHWKYGMEWFKEQLIDHDKCVNRGNWMWLSGTAFSSKQRSFFHYNYDNFITNKDKKLKVTIK